MTDEGESGIYLHLGNSVVVKKPDIIGVFDLDNSSYSAITRDFLTREEKAGRVKSVAELELPKSFVVCSGEDGSTVYLCQLNSSTLLKRSEGNALE